MNENKGSGVLGRSSHDERVSSRSDGLLLLFRLRRVWINPELTGRTDRVTMEIERENLVHPREVSRKVHGRADALEIIQHIGPLLESAEVKFLEVELNFQGNAS
jgi:hypothetical protein